MISSMSFSRPKKYSRWLSSYGSRPTYGERSDVRSAPALAARDVTVALALEFARETIQILVEDPHAAAAPHLALEGGRHVLDRPRVRWAAPGRACCRVVGGSRRQPQVVKQHAQVPVAQAVPEEQETPGVEVPVKDRGNGLALRHAGEELGVVLLGNHAGVAVWRRVRGQRAVHFEDHRGRREVDHKLIGRHGVRSGGAVRPPED